MKHVIIDLFHMYLAMIVYYLLKLPYVLKVLIGIELCAIILYFFVKLALFFIRKITGKICLRCYIIIILQTAVYGMTKLMPGFRKKGENIDEVLNNYGLKLSENRQKENDKKRKGGAFSYVFWGVLALSFIFLIIPYYMEPMMEGSAKDICARMNHMSLGFQEEMQNYVDKHYNPVQASSANTEDENNSDEIKTEEKYVLHLGKKGYHGANLRKSPKLKKSNIITAISGDIELIYENETYDDGKRIWLKVSTKDVPEAWISKKLIRKKDLKAAGIS